MKYKMFGAAFLAATGILLMLSGFVRIAPEQVSPGGGQAGYRGKASASAPVADPLEGAWLLNRDQGERLLLFQDGYCMFTDFSKEARTMELTRGGWYQFKDGTIEVKLEFHSRKKESVGMTIKVKAQIRDDKLMVDVNGNRETYIRQDQGTGPLAGVWRISGRMQNGKMIPRELRSRRTLKLLTGKYFQWAAIDIESGTFSGTGGGTYTFGDGKYVEHIEFFSRDGSRVGASLSFDGRVENKVWTHSGLSSAGQPINETWVPYTR